MQATQFKEIDNTASKLVYTPQLDNATPENTEKGRALEAIAKRAGVSHMTAFQYDKIQQQGTEEQKAEVAEGKSSIKKVYTQIQKAERLKTIAVVCLNKARRVGMSKVPYIYDFKSSHLKLRNSGLGG